MSEPLEITQPPADSAEVQESKKMTPLQAIFAGQTAKNKFQELLGKKATGFVASILQIVNSSGALQTANPMTVYAAASIAATLDLPINQNLGFAWIVPYKGQAQFQMGYKGYIQLALRTGQYSRLNVTPVYHNQFISWNELTEELQANFNGMGAGEIVGYCCYFKLINGFEKTAFWPMRRVQEHAKRFSQSFNSNTSPWKSDFDAMAMKTVLKNTLAKWGILSIEMQRAVVVDQGVIHDEEGIDVTYPDNEDPNQQKSKAATDAATKKLQGSKNVAGTHKAGKAATDAVASEFTNDVRKG
jgi:recombination protein RecT